MPPHHRSDDYVDHCTGTPMPYEPNFLPFIDFLPNEENSFNSEIIRKISLVSIPPQNQSQEKKGSKKKAPQKRNKSKIKNNRSNNDNDDDWSSNHMRMSVKVRIEMNIVI